MSCGSDGLCILIGSLGQEPRKPLRRFNRSASCNVSHDSSFSRHISLTSCGLGSKYPQTNRIHARRRTSIERPAAAYIGHTNRRELQIDNVNHIH